MVLLQNNANAGVCSTTRTISSRMTRKNGKTTGPKQGEQQGRQLWAGRSDGFFRLRREWGGGREPEDGSQGKRLRQLASTSCYWPRRTRVDPASPRPKSLGGQPLLVRPQTRFCAERPGRFRRREERPRCRPGVGTAQVFFWRQRDPARPSEIHGFPRIRRHGSMRAHRAFAAGGPMAHFITKFSEKGGDLYV